MVVLGDGEDGLCRTARSISREASQRLRWFRPQTTDDEYGSYFWWTAPDDRAMACGFLAAMAENDEPLPSEES